MQIDKVTIVPTDNSEDPNVTLDVTDKGYSYTVKGGGCLLVVPLPDAEYYVASQGNIANTIGFMATQFLDKESFMFQAMVASMGAAIKSADKDQILTLYNTCTALLDLCADRNDELINPNNR